MTENLESQATENFGQGEKVKPRSNYSAGDLSEYESQYDGSLSCNERITLRDLYGQVKNFYDDFL